MNDVEKLFEQTLNKKNILKINKNEFMEYFLNESESFEDFDYIKNNFPEYLNCLNFKEKWTDVNKIIREVNENYFIICKEMKDAIYILGEIKFKEDGKILFGRYSKNGMFSRMDSFIIHNDKIFKGTIPSSEYIYPLKETSFERSFYLENEQEYLRILINGSSLRITFRKKTKEIETYIYLNNLLDSSIVISKDDLVKQYKYKDSKSNGKIDDAIYNTFKICDKLIGDDFKKNELNTYFKIYDIFSDIYSKVRIRQ